MKPNANADLIIWDILMEGNVRLTLALSASSRVAVRGVLDGCRKTLNPACTLVTTERNAKGRVRLQNDLEAAMYSRRPVTCVISMIAMLAALPVMAQTSGSSGTSGSSSSGTTGPSRSGGTPSATSPSRSGPTDGTLNNRAVAPNAVPSPGNSPLPSQSSGTSPGATPGTPRSGQGVTGASPQGAAGSSGANGQDATTVEPNFRGGNAPATAQDGKPNPNQPGTGGIQGMGERSSTSDTGAYGKSVEECMTAFDPANHMTKEQWRETCERTTTR